MKNFKSIATGFLMAALLYSNAPTAHAIPIGWTVFDLNGHSVAQDAAGNQWLSPTATQGQSFNSALASVWVVNEGFGAVSSIVPLFTAYGLPTTTTPDKSGTVSGWDPFDFESPVGGEAKTFLFDFGETQEADDPGNSNFLSLSWGWLAPTSGTVFAQAAVGLLNTNGTDHGGVLIADLPGSITGDTAINPNYGTWLFKAAAQTSVPEPGTLAIMGLGLAGLGFARRRRLI